MTEDEAKTKWLKRFMEKVDWRSPDCWLWTAGTASTGYGKFWLDGKMQSAHRVSFMFTHGRNADGLVLHRCGNRRCVRPSHLYEGTHKDNHKDMVNDGNLVVLRGEDSPASKLTESQVALIRASNLSTRKLGRIFDVGSASISRIKRGVDWKHSYCGLAGEQ